MEVGFTHNLKNEHTQNTMHHVQNMIDKNDGWFFPLIFFVQVNMQTAG